MLLRKINVNVLEDKYIDIWGSCVSRDIFGDIKGHVKNYIARQSIISLFQSPINIFDDSIKNDSQFQLRLLKSDLHKDAIFNLKKEHAKWLILDFIDERFSLVKIGSSYATGSSEFYKSIPNAKNYPVLKRAFKDGVLLLDEVPVEKYLKDFISKITNIYEHIIIHKVFLVDVYFKDGHFYRFDDIKLANNKVVNKMLSEYYKLVQKHLPNSIIVEAYGFPASASHKWGLSPMHFVDEYYADIKKQIQNITCISLENQG